MKIYEMGVELEDLTEMYSDAMDDLINERKLSEQLYTQYSKTIHERENGNVR
jgi:hypothetical protein